MHPQGRFRDEDFQLIEVAQQIAFQLADEPGPPSLAKIQCGQDDYSIEVNRRRATEWEVAEKKKGRTDAACVIFLRNLTSSCEQFVC